MPSFLTAYNQKRNRKADEINVSMASVSQYNNILANKSFEKEKFNTIFTY